MMNKTYSNGQIEKAIQDLESGKALIFGYSYCLLRNVKVLARVNYVSGDFVFANVAIKMPNGARVRYVDHCYNLNSLTKLGLLS